MIASAMQTPDNLEHFESVGDRAFFRPVGKMTLREAIQLVTRAITFAGERRIRRLLVNASGLTGFPSPTLPERYFLAREWAAAAPPGLRLALVVCAEMIDPEKFGILVARNAGLDAEVFSDDSDALSWLTLR